MAYRQAYFMLFIIQFILSNGIETRYTTKVFLKRNKGFRNFNPTLGYGYYLAVNLLHNKTLLVHDRVQRDILFFLSYDWIYDSQENTLTNCESSLCLTAYTSDWTLNLDKCGKINQDFIYDAVSNELFWKNPKTKKLHVIYIQQDICHRGINGLCRCLIASRSMDMFGNQIEEISTIKLRRREWKVLSVYCLSKHNGTRDLSSDTVQYWLGIIESFSFHNVTFGLFKTRRDRYLIGDGYIIANVDPKEFEASKYKYYGLWRIDSKTGALYHYLSEYEI